MDSKQNLTSLAASFSSPPPRQRQITINDDGTPTPPPNPNSKSPYSIIKRKTDSMRNNLSYDYWRTTCRWVLFWKNRGVCLTNDGKIDFYAWAQNWVNIKRLPHYGLMNLNCFAELGGTYIQWVNMQNNIYKTKQTLVDKMVEGEELYRQYCKNKHDKIGHVDHKYKRINSGEKKGKLSRKRPFTDVDTEITVPSSKRHKPEDKELETVRKQSIEQMEIDEATRRSIEDDELEKAKKQSIEQLVFHGINNYNHASVPNYNGNIMDLNGVNGHIIGMNGHVRHNGYYNLHNMHGNGMNGNDNNNNMRNISFGNKNIHGLNGQNSNMSNIYDNNYLHGMNTRSDFINGYDSGFSPMSIPSIINPSNGVTNSFNSPMQYMNTNTNNNINQMNNITANVNSIREYNSNNNNNNNNNNNIRECDNNNNDCPMTLGIENKDINNTKQHPLEAFNIEHAFKVKANSKGTTKTETDNKKKVKIKKKRTVRPIENVVVSVKGNIISVKEGKSFTKLDNKYQSIIGIGIMNYLVDNDADLTLFPMGNKSVVQGVLNSVGKKGKNKYHLCGVLVDNSVCRIILDSDYDGKFVLQDKQRHGYYVHHKVAKVIDDSLQGLIALKGNFKDAMQSEI